jgi:hypothetical protein
LNLCKFRTFSAAGLFTVAKLVAALSVAAGLPLAAQSTAPQHTQLVTQTGNALGDCESSTAGSPYIPLDSWIYPAVTRLNALGYVHGVYLGMRPWTRLNVILMLEDTSSEVQDADLYGDSTAGEAENLYASLMQELSPDIQPVLQTALRRVSSRHIRWCALLAEHRFTTATISAQAS